MIVDSLLEQRSNAKSTSTVLDEIQEEIFIVSELKVKC